MLTLDLIQEEEAPSWEAGHSPECPRSQTDSTLSARTAEVSGKSQSLPRDVTVVWEQPGPDQNPQSHKNRCASMDEMLTESATVPVRRLQQLIEKQLEKTELLLGEMRVEAEAKGGVEARVGADGKAPTERDVAQRLLKEAKAAWNQAYEVLEEVKELRALYLQLDSNSTKNHPD